MENNINLDVSFNEWDVSLEKTLTQPKSALFSSSYYENHCQVKLDFKYRHTLNLYVVCHFSYKLQQF